jgi:SAM-dependent methyltransferase
VEEVRCPLCGSDDVRLWLESRSRDRAVSSFGPSRRETSPGRILQCRGCGLAFRHPPLTASELSRLYSELPADLYDAESAGRARTAVRHVRILARHASPGRLLDVGCASGAFLSAAAEAGWQVVGVEPARALCDKAAVVLGGRGRVICAPLEAAAPELGKFDAVTLWDVLEHVERPLDFLRVCGDLLKSGGHLLLNVPDIESLPARIMGARWPLLLPEHLTYFTRDSLDRCARLAGFEPLTQGRRPASFSVDYVLYRLGQHRIPFAAGARRLAARLGVARGLLAVPLGELYAVWRR